MNQSPEFDQPFFGVAPTIANQPPPIFGNYGPDGNLLPPSLPSGPMFPDDPFSFGDDGDSNDPKRRRIARACDMCRRKKIKCDGKLPSCSHCQNYKTECVFTHIEKKRNPPKGAKYIEGLENRLGRMEALLRLTGVLSDDDGKDPDLATLEQRLVARTSDVGTPGTSRSDSRQGSAGPHSLSSPTTMAVDAPKRRSSPGEPPVVTIEKDKEPKKDDKDKEKEKEKDREPDVEALSDMMDSLVTNNHGETRYIGSSSSFSIFSPKGIRWVSDKIGDSSFQQMIANSSRDDNKWFHWRPEIFGDIFARKQFKALPPKEECFSLLRDFFETFNKMFPLFHYETFMYLAEKQYSDQPYEGSGWWASLNVVLAISYRLRVMANTIPSEDESIGWAYLKNALAVQTELTLRNTDLFSVQALIGMCLFLQGSPNPQPVVNLIGSAIRLAQSIGLHKRGSAFGLNATELEQRKRVFWIAYMVDKDMSLRSGHPPCQNDDDWNVDLPSENPADGLGNIPLSDGSGSINLFHRMCRFAVIEGKIYSQLYSVKASKQTDGELLNHIGELDQDLEQWKDSIPLEFRPEHEINPNINEALIMEIVMLHFAYYNSVMTIHRMSVHHGYWSSRLSNYALKGLNVKPLNPRVFSSAMLCVQAARASINLIKYIPAGDYACVWLIIYYPVSSLVTLFANILQNPQDARARSDLRLINLVVSFLSKLCLEETSGSIRRMYIICREFERIAGIVLSKAEKEMSTRQKRKQDREDKKLERIHQAPNQQQRQRQPFDGSVRTNSTSRSNLSPGAETGPLLSPAMTQDGLPLNQMDHMPSPSNATFGFDQSQQANGLGGSPWQANMETPGSTGSIGNMQGLDFGFGDVSGNMQSVLSGGAFQHPFVPQDLWNMSSTFEWDWAELQNQDGFGVNSAMNQGGE